MEKVKKFKLGVDDRIEVGLYTRYSEWPNDEDDYYIVGVNNWIINSEGKFLVQRRALTKKDNPGKWSSTNGLVQLNENNVETVKRKAKEELGIDITDDQIKLFKKNYVARKHLLVDIFVTCIDVSLEDIIIQTSEVDEVAFVSLEELLTFDISNTCAYIKNLGEEMLELTKTNK